MEIDVAQKSWMNSRRDEIEGVLCKGDILNSARGVIEERIRIHQEGLRLAEDFYGVMHHTFLLALAGQDRDDLVRQAREQLRGVCFLAKEYVACL
jgi:predicted DNA-binding helix-hairpin-helix protein